eukprot:363869-Chlamydomonas_euryale.AAC.2
MATPLVTSAHLSNPLEPLNKRARNGRLLDPPIGTCVTGLCYTTDLYKCTPHRAPCPERKLAVNI